MNKIKLLSPQVANQIAAGEVIERPASIIKELMENSIDAGADDITVIINRSGTSLIKIIDNGCGIGREDLPLAISQHATSKIATIADLERVSSLGFRGEALASICSAARVKITSKVDEQEALSLESNGDPSEYNITPAAHPVGTTIEVRDLFYNIPVRRRFLKSLKTEYYHIIEIFQKMSLGHFACSFTLISDDKVIYKLPKANNKFARDNRVKKIFGYSFINNALYFEGEAPSIKIHGWVSNASYTRSQTDQQYFFLNNRVIRDKLILHAIKYAYETLIPSGRHPCYILYLTIDPGTVDVNVHPTKHEVRFAESRWVHQFMVQQLSNVLLAYTQEELVKPDESEVSEGLEKLEEQKGGAEERASSDLFNNTVPATSFTSKNSFPEFATQNYSRSFSYFQKPERHYSAREDHDVKVQSNNVISNLGKIIINIGNNLAITAYQNNYYLVDIKQSYCFLVYSKLVNEWRSNQLLTSYDLLLKPTILFSEFDASVQNKIFYSRLEPMQKIYKLLEKSKQYGFEVTLNYNSENCFENSSEQEYVIANESGEIWNSIVIHKVPEACRFGDASELFMILLANLVQNNIENEDQTKMLNLFASKSVSRLDGSLLETEKQIIIDKLAKKEYNGMLGYISKFCKKLEERDFCGMLTD